MQARRWLQLGLLLAASVPLIAACEFSGPQSALDPAGPVAQAQLDIFLWTYWLSWPVMIGVFGALIYALWRFRAKNAKDATAVPHQTHGNMRLEIAWTIIPVVLVVLVAVPTVRTVFQTEQRITPAMLSADDVIVRSTGYQWWFKFEYPELGIITANELIIPVGQRVVMALDSADVLHSFWVPRLAGKRDMIPNNDNQIWFIANEAGTYYGQCAELCLGAHAYMRFRVIAMERPDYDRWVAAFQNASQASLAQADPLVDRGRQLVAQKGCVACHVIDGYSAGATVGNPAFPSLTNFGLRTTVGAALLDNTPENLAAWLRDPQALKPGNRMPTLWTATDPNRNDEIDAVVAYLLSLGREPATLAGLTPGGFHGGQ
ncbi:MAG: cytochrome c oxidase subunit II [bacterium]|nr:cytochrome c oxidase subunit II [bacterium]